MFRLRIAWERSARSACIIVWELLQDGLQFMNVVATSRTAVAAEVLFLRKQLAYYQEHQIRPRRLTDAARLSLVLWSRLFRLERSADRCHPGDFHPTKFGDLVLTVLHTRSLDDVCRQKGPSERKTPGSSARRA
jgi:hypothetical protein